MAINMSLDAKLYRGAAGSTANTEVNTCKDVSLKMKKGEAKIADKASGQGLDADFEIMEMDDEQKLEEGVTIKFTIKPTYVSRYPAWN